MTKLIRADLARMIKTKSFWICGVTAVVTVFGNFLLRYFNNKELAQHLGSRIFADSSNLVLLAAVFSSLFIGTDYSNGTIRNKIIVGHKRCSIYFSNLITVSAAGILYVLASRLPVLIFGLSAGGQLGMSGGEFALKVMITLISMISVCSMFTLAGMLISSKSSNVVVTLVGVIVLLTGSALILELLNAPEYISAGYTISVDGVVQPDEPYLNPLYIRGAMRVFLQTVCDVLPMGQVMELEMGIVNNSGFLPLYSVVFAAVFSVIGAAGFVHKDLK